MRNIGTLPDGDQAQRFVDHLFTQGIAAVAEPESDAGGTHQLWIRDEDQVTRAVRELQDFRAQPHDPRYDQASTQAERLRREQQRETTRRKKLQRSMPRSTGAFPIGIQRSTPVTIVIGIACIAVALLTDLGGPAPGSTGAEIIRQLKFADPADALRTEAPLRTGTADPLASIRQGEWWRLITPIFLHFGMLHLLFNMLLFFSLGAALERMFGSLRLVLLVIPIAIISNGAQATFPDWLGGSVNFGGISGVVYGLFGYLWILTLLRPSIPIRIPDSAVIMLLGWLLIGMLPMFPINMANVAHFTGLLSGIALVLLTQAFTR